MARRPPASPEYSFDEEFARLSPEEQEWFLSIPEEPSLQPDEVKGDLHPPARKPESWA